ncbi:ABC transporter substrate-binding protein, partial [Christensenellaceae bacterium OttesenSCG-928-M15]|nr:ABC transporter substrate-binding protein [Christensenellaceae bacterium OttesenSCG-928-M15]
TFGAVGVMNAFVEMMGEGDKICHDMPPRFADNARWKLQYEFAPQMKGLLQFEDGNDVLIENVLQVKPDVCVTMTKSTAEFLAEHGLAAVYFEWKGIEDIPVAVTLMGEVLNKPDVAADYIQYFDEKVAYANSLTADLADEDRQKVVYGSVIELSQPHIIAEWWITEAGAISVTNDGREEESLTYSIEDLLKWNPDVILMSSNQRDDIKAEKRYANIPAVKNDRMYAMPTVAHVWGNRSVEQILTIFYAMNKIYPDLMPDEKLAEEIGYFYSHFFKYDLSDDQLAEIINN